jgi:hypothetical protein
MKVTLSVTESPAYQSLAVEETATPTNGHASDRLPEMRCSPRANVAYFFLVILYWFGDMLRRVR